MYEFHLRHRGSNVQWYSGSPSQCNCLASAFHAPRSCASATSWSIAIAWQSSKRHKVSYICVHRYDTHSICYLPVVFVFFLGLHPAPIGTFSNQSHTCGFPLSFSLFMARPHVGSDFCHIHYVDPKIADCSQIVVFVSLVLL